MGAILEAASSAAASLHQLQPWALRDRSADCNFSS